MTETEDNEVAAVAMISSPLVSPASSSSPLSQPRSSSQDLVTSSSTHPPENTRPLSNLTCSPPGTSYTPSSPSSPSLPPYIALSPSISPVSFSSSPAGSPPPLIPSEPRSPLPSLPISPPLSHSSDVVYQSEMEDKQEVISSEQDSGEFNKQPLSLLIYIHTFDCL